MAYTTTWIWNIFGIARYYVDVQMSYCLTSGFAYVNTNIETIRTKFFCNGRSSFIDGTQELLVLIIIRIEPGCYVTFRDDQRVPI